MSADVALSESESFQGVFGRSALNAGVVDESDQFHAVFAVSHSVHNGGVIGSNDAGGFGVIGQSDTGVGIFGSGQLAGQFKGPVQVEGRVDMNGPLIVGGRNITGQLDQLRGWVSFDDSDDLRIIGKFGNQSLHNRVLELEKAVNVLQEKLGITPRINVGL